MRNWALRNDGSWREADAPAGTRDTVLRSSNGGAKVNWAPGPKTVLNDFVGDPALMRLALGAVGAAVADITGTLALTGEISPAQITADQNDYNPTGLATASTLRLSSDATRAITGLAGGVDGRVVIIENISANAIVLSDESASSTAANRFALPQGDVTLLADDAVTLKYDGTASRWRVVGLSPRKAPTIQVFTAGGTWTKPAGLRRAKVTVVGGGGGGGASGVGWAGGGGAGGTAIKLIVAASLGATETVTIGAAGNGGNVGAGTSGGTSSFGSHCSATGSAGSLLATGGASSTSLGGVGGTASGGDVNIPGQGGINGDQQAASQGGSTMFGRGGNAGASANGVAASGYGAGGGGAGDSAW